MQAILYLCVILLVRADENDFEYSRTSVDFGTTARALGRQNNTEVFEYEGHEYIFHLEPRTWNEASAICQKEESYLAVLEDSHEVAFVGHAMYGHFCTNTILQNVWIGGRYYADANRWLWESTGYEMIGKTKEYPPWDRTDRRGFDCVNLQQSVKYEPKFTNIDCVLRRRFLCERGCPKLYDTDRGYWYPDGCLLDPSYMGDTCRLMCNPGLELDGPSPLLCTRTGWKSSMGVNIVPDCKVAAELADNFLEDLKVILDYSSNICFAFIIDEAAEPHAFQLQIKFIHQIIRNFPLSSSRLACIIGNGKVARAIRSAQPTDTCDFLYLLRDIYQVETDKSDLATALSTARKFCPSQPNVLPIYFVLSGSDTVQEDVDAANVLKREGSAVIAVGVEKFDRDILLRLATSSYAGPLFYGFSNASNFNRVIARLQDTGVQQSCQLEGAGDLAHTLKGALGSKSNVLFVLDQTADWGQQQFDMAHRLLQAIASAHQLPQKREVGVISGTQFPLIAIPLRSSKACIFYRWLSKITYQPSRSNMSAAMLLATLEASKSKFPQGTVLVTISPSLLPYETIDRTCKTIQILLDTTDATQTIDNGDPHTRDLIADDDSSQVLNINTVDKYNSIIEELQGNIPQDHLPICALACPPLEANPRGIWEGEVCSKGPVETGQLCFLHCQDPYELMGSYPLICGEQGWTGTAGDDAIPICLKPEELADLFMEKVKASMGNGIPSNLLFVLDESGSVTLPNFKMEIQFMGAVVDAFPLSGHRSAGVMTFSDRVRVLIALNANDTCRFIRMSHRIRYNGGGTDIKKALLMAQREVQKRAAHPQTLLFLITDGISQTDPYEVAGELRKEGVVLFAIGVADYQQQQLEPLASTGPDGTNNFFGVKSFHVFNVIAQYLNECYKVEGSNCTREKLTE